MNIVTKDGLNHFWGELKKKFALLSGATFTGQVQNTNGDMAFKHTNGASIGFGVGSGKVNRGLWDYTNNQWLIYCASDKYPLLNQSPATSDNSTKVATTGFVKAQGYLTATSLVKEAYIDWGGRNFSSSYSPIDACMIGELGANRLAFGKANGIIVEYSRDNGETWNDYGATDNEKVALFSTSTSFVIGKSTKTEQANGDCLLRVTIDTDVFKVYTELNKFVIYLSSDGSQQCWCTIDASIEATPDTFVTFADKVAVSGWTGYNVINVNKIKTYGNTPATQYGLVRFTFGCVSHNVQTSGTYAGLRILKIRGFGGVGWQTPSTMASQGTIYTYDANQNVTFPANISAVAFTENGTLLSAKYLGIKSKAESSKSADSVAWANVSGKPTFFSGNYNDLTNKPTIPSAYELPKASATTLGGIKVGNNLTIDSNGVLSAVGGSGGGISINDVYPVGSVYFSVNNTNPATLFGGTWESVGNNLKISSTDYFWGGIDIYAFKRIS